MLALLLSALLTWQPGQRQESQEIQRFDYSNPQAGYVVLEIVAPSLAEYEDTSLGYEKACYRVRGLNMAGSGPWSNEACTEAIQPLPTQPGKLEVKRK